MTKKELYEKFPSKMTANSLNMKKGIYMQIPYSFPDGKFMWKPYI